MIFIVPILLFRVFWDDPNPVGNVVGYNVYSERNTGTGQIFRKKLNTELIPWMEDGEKTPFYITSDLTSGDSVVVTAVGVNEESEDSNPFVVPYPPDKTNFYVRSTE
jgi:hypothetical protein